MRKKQFLLFLLFASSVLAIECEQLKMISDQLVIEKVIDNKDELDLVDLGKINKNIIIDIKYATNDNFMGEPIYSSNKCYLRKHIAKALDSIQKELEPMGFGLKVFDGFRPVAAQELGFARFPKFFAPPNEERSKHTKGTAVDLTLVDKDGNEVLMPTEFDSFEKRAFRTCRKELDPKQIENREVLEIIMAKHGFIGLAHEWWHFDHYTWKSHTMIKKDFGEIEKILGT